MKRRIGIFQYKFRNEKPQERIKRLEEKIKRIKKKVDFIVCPELFLSGSAKFESKADESEILTPLKTRFHKSFQPRSLTTHNEKCLSLVAWRDKLNSEIKVIKN